ncbi:MAG: N-acetyltransferase [Synechococcales cyanobacterium T60_A2020_003]|nr:N-acetyltransferase [Synechococcales cyanobacterium T60_A2020_003]
MIIRDAGKDDLASIVDIYNSTVHSRMVTADLQPIAVEDRLSWFHSHKPHQRPLWVAESDGRVAGWLSMHSFYGRPAYHITAELSIYISPDYRHCGIGSQLLQAAIEKSPSFGLVNLVGFIFAHNTPSLGLFKKFGFQQWGYLPEVAEFEGVLRDLVIVGLKLGGSDA